MWEKVKAVDALSALFHAAEGSSDNKLQMTGHSQGNRFRLTLVGELIQGYSANLFTAAKEIIGKGFSDLIIDLDGISYCDTSGLQSLVQVYKFSSLNDSSNVTIFAKDGFVLQTLRTCRFDKFMTITHDPTVFEGDWQDL
jgi:anti-anti-sigma factor